MHEPLREKLKQQINHQLELEFSRFQTMTIEELQNEIKALKDQGVDSSNLGIEPNEYEEMKKEFSALSHLQKEELGIWGVTEKVWKRVDEQWLLLSDMG